MNETVWVALIAVLGTSLGAAISPTIAAIRESNAERSGSRSDRLRAAAEFGTKLLKFGRTVPGKYDGLSVAQAHQDVIEARFELARHLNRGEGNVDRFVEHAIAMVEGHKDNRRRQAAQYGASTVLSWARGDLAASKLDQFSFERNGDEYVLI